jgi:hypothetical protein
METAGSIIADLLFHFHSPFRLPPPLCFLPSEFRAAGQLPENNQRAKAS